MATDADEVPEPYVLRGQRRYHPVPTWHWRVQNHVMALARHLDEWNSRLPEPVYEIFNHPFCPIRERPPTATRIPLAVVPGQFPTLASAWVPALPFVAAEVMLGPAQYGDVSDRVDEYLDCGVAVVWVLTPDFRTVTVHRAGADPVALDARGTLAGDPELPGFSCRVADLFR